MHRLGAQELADRRAQHRPAVAHARIGRQAAALELDLLRAARRLELAEPQGPAVAELAGPDAELMAAVDACQRLHAGPQGVAAEYLHRLPVRALAPAVGQSELGRTRVADR